MRLLVLITTIIASILFISSIALAYNGIFDIKSGETAFDCNKFECNGSYIVSNQAWMLNTVDNMKFRSDYEAKWQFSKIPVSFIIGDTFKLVFNCRVWDTDPNEGGRPGFAYVKVSIPVPSQDRIIVKQIELSNTINGTIQPTILSLPKNVLPKNGSLKVSVIGKGWIEVQPKSLKVVSALSSKPLKP